VTVEEAYGKNWEMIAAFTYDNVKYSMVKILEPVLILAKEGQVRRRHTTQHPIIAVQSLIGDDWFCLHLLSCLFVQPFGSKKNIPNWLLASEDEAERVAPIMEELIKARLGVVDDDEDNDEEEEE